MRNVRRLTAPCLPVLLLLSCVGALPRNSVITRGLEGELGLGPAVFRGVNVKVDTSYHDFLPVFFVTNPLEVGLQGHGRIGYGFSPKFGVDLTLAMYYGTPFSDTFDRTGMWDVKLAGKYHPFRTNNLFLLEAGFPNFGLGWVGGFPQHGRELVSVSAEVLSAVPYAIAMAQDNPLPQALDILRPNSLAVNVAGNLYLGRSRLSPNVGFTVATPWFWGNTSGFWNLTAGVAFSP